MDLEEPISSEFRRIEPLKKVRQLAAGASHVLALDASQKLWAFGTGSALPTNQHAITDSTCRYDLAPHVVPGLRSKVARMGCAERHSFAVDVDGTTHGFGADHFGQLGIADLHAHMSVARRADQLRKWTVQQATGGSQHSLACTTGGEVLAWGRCNQGQLGGHGEKREPDASTIGPQAVDGKHH